MPGLADEAGIHLPETYQEHSADQDRCFAGIDFSTPIADGYDTKSATVCSLVTILFAQISKLGSVALTTGFSPFDLSMLPVMVVGAVAGGFIRATLNKKLPEAAVDRVFNAVQLLVLALTLFNIARSLF